MHRKKPQSGKAKKEQLQAHRALKSGRNDEPASPVAQLPPATIVTPGNRTSTAANGRLFALGEQRRTEARRSARSALESRFIRLSAAHVEHYKSVVAKRPFKRPIEESLGYLRAGEDLGLQDTNGQADAEEQRLLCPKRPKWKYHMLKKEVEKNESVMFEKWLAETERKLHHAESQSEYKVMGYFERNLDVWRQLWRVTEASEILLVLLDVRCPMLHFPLSLQDYITTLKPRKKCILILTKVDLVPRQVAESWKNHFETEYGYDVVLVESYKEHARGERTQGTRMRFDPGASAEVREHLVKALQAAHHNLASPPPWVKPERIATWRPRLRTDIEWGALETEPDLERHKKLNERMKAAATATAIEEKNGSGSKADAKKARKMERQEALDADTRKHLEAFEQSRKAKEEEKELQTDPDRLAVIADVEEDEQEAEAQGRAVEQPAFLSIGLIGQPNVGKSSLLNALLGKKVVRASKTPGKTKTLQTIFWTPEVRLVDCPGLVFPSYVGMEKQVISAVIPIQNVEAVVHEIGQRMPLEDILQLRQMEDEPWSTDSLLSTLAIDRGFLTAKAARPDVYRAGSMLVRAFQSSQIAWAFRPSKDKLTGIEQEGIYIKLGSQVGSELDQIREEEIGAEQDEEHKLDSTSTEESELDSEGSVVSEETEEEEEVAEGPGVRKFLPTTSAFSMLAVDSGSDDDDGE